MQAEASCTAGEPALSWTDAHSPGQTHTLLDRRTLSWTDTHSPGQTHSLQETHTLLGRHSPGQTHILLDRHTLSWTGDIQYEQPSIANILHVHTPCHKKLSRMRNGVVSLHTFSQSLLKVNLKRCRMVRAPLSSVDLTMCQDRKSVV